jgi:hypothetical protein
MVLPVLRNLRIDLARALIEERLEIAIAVRELEDWMKTTANPHYDGFFEYGVGEPHCYSGRTTVAEKRIEIADFIAGKRPYVEAVPWWKH